MADLRFTADLDDRGFGRGLDSIELRTAASAGRMAGSLKRVGGAVSSTARESQRASASIASIGQMMGVTLGGGMVIQYAIDSMREYGDAIGRVGVVAGSTERRLQGMKGASAAT